jgi:hypothetical protein
MRDPHADPETLLDVLVASSSEQVEIAATVASLLKAARPAGRGSPMALAARPWTESTFSFSDTYIESLERELDRADFAIVILTASDIGHVRGRQVNLPRDNVIFELGLFTGRLGRSRCFFFVDATSKTRIASDLSGVKEVDFVPGRCEPRERRLPGRCREVAAQMTRLGPRYKPSPEARQKQHEAWRVATEIAGCWWSLRYWDKGRLGFVTLAVDDSLPTLNVLGRAFAPDAPNQVTASWESVSSTLKRSEKAWTLYFVWSGFYPSQPNKTFRGTSKYEFPIAPERPATGSGRMLEASLSNLRETRQKAIELRRCTEHEERIMKEGSNRAKSELLRKRLGSWKARRPAR